MAPLLHELLAEPFGPYIESEILTDTCKSIPTNVLCLKNLLLECGGKPIGLNTCEAGPECTVTAADVVRFRGVLEIRDLSWLTPAGKKIIERKLRERDVYSRIRDGNAARSNLTLDNIYAKNVISHSHSRLIVKVTIQGIKSMAAGYLTSRRYAHGGLIIHSSVSSKNGQRDYQVLSMDIETYERSRTYLARYRALRALEDIVAASAQAAAPNPPPPLEKRTPQWFVTQYIEHMVSIPSAQGRRLVYMSSDSDIEPGTNGRLRSGRKRTFRHVSKAEIYSLIARHVRWLVEDQRARKQNKLFDVGVWEAWSWKANQTRAEAEKEGISWGRWDDIALIQNGDPADGSSDGDDAGPRPPPPLKKKYKKKKKSNTSQFRASNSRASTFRASTSRASTSTSTTLPTHSATLSGSSDEDTPLALAAGNIYDPDFSPPSTPNASDSDSSVYARPPTPPDPEILARIPRAFFFPPAIPPGFVFHCPARGCPHTIDLLSLTEAECKLLGPELSARMKHGRWLLSEDWVYSCFAELVTEHWYVHFHQEGIRWYQDGKKRRLGWVKPHLHRQRPLLNQQPAVIKQEEDL